MFVLQIQSTASGLLRHRAGGLAAGPLTGQY